MGETVKVVLSTQNRDKAREIRGILSFDWLEIVERPAHIPEIPETGETLEENALTKAKTLVKETGMAAIADDTGLEVVVLDGAPGIMAARYAGPTATYSDNVIKLLGAMNGKADRRAEFVTVATYCDPEGNELIARGVVTGTIDSEARGRNGFGYDPIFVPDEGHGRTFAEMTAAEKGAISHRGRAFRELAKQLATLDRTITGG